MGPREHAERLRWIIDATTNFDPLDTAAPYR